MTIKLFLFNFILYLYHAKKIRRNFDIKIRKKLMEKCIKFQIIKILS